MAWAAAYDAVQRTFRMGGDRGAGLRGGTFTRRRRGDRARLHRVRFAGDVAVSGHARLAGGEVVAELDVDGPGAEDGTLRVTGRVFPHTSLLTARGVIGGRRVAVLVPSA